MTSSGSGAAPKGDAHSRAPRSVGVGPASVAVVTGGNRGLGGAIAADLVRRGYRVATCSTSTRPPGLGEALHRRVDVTDAAAVEAFVTELHRQFGRVDVLVNNAGYSQAPSPLAQTPEEVARACFATNVLGPYFLLRRVLPLMLAQPEGGAIVNIASRAALVPVPGLAAYSASKTALVALTLALAKEAGNDRVFCVAVCPGGINTEMRAALYGAADAGLQLDPKVVATLVGDLATDRALEGRAVRSGSAVLVTRDDGVTVLDWPEDARGRRSLIPR